MRFYVLCFICGLLPVIFLGCSDSPSSSDPTIRVWLSQVKLPCHIKINGSYHLKSRGKLLYEGQQLASILRIANQKIYLGELNCGVELDIQPLQNAPILLHNSVYYGNLIIRCQEKNSYLLCNELFFESYTSAVISPWVTEETPTSLADCYAVMARTYALHEKINNASQEFDVKDTLEGQLYLGNDLSNAANDAVQATSGLVMLYQNRPFRPFYHTACGGATTSAAWIFGCPELTPLAGGVCPYCTQNQNLPNWSYTLQSSDLQRLCLIFKIASQQEIVQSPLSLSVLYHDSYNRAVTLQLRCGNKIQHIPALQVCNQFPIESIPSNCFQIYLHEDGIQLVGKGQGHGVGLCQTGATIAAQTHRASEILLLYYPGINLYRLW